MKKETREILNTYCKKYEFINTISKSIEEVFTIINNCYLSGNKVLVCGNGGSNSDADHIVGELLKGFNKLRPLSETEKQKFLCFGEEGIVLAQKLQGSLPAINLGAHISLMTAVINDIGGEEIYAQQVMGYGNEGDVLLGISTSGNSKNVIKAGIVAKVKGLKTIALTGAKGGRMGEMFDSAIKVPSNITCDIQDMHTTVYHILCAMIESERWSN